MEYFDSVHAHKPKFGLVLFFAIACFKLFSCPFPLLFELFFCKKIPLGRRVEYVMDGSMDQSVSQ